MDLSSIIKRISGHRPRRSAFTTSSKNAVPVGQCGTCQVHGCVCIYMSITNSQGMNTFCLILPARFLTVVQTSFLIIWLNVTANLLHFHRLLLRIHIMVPTVRDWLSAYHPLWI